MKAALVVAALLSLLSHNAHAISRYDAQSMACERTQAIVRNEGMVILRFTSPRNVPLYDLYVAHGGYCANGEYAQAAWVPTSDAEACPVLRCLQRGYDDY